MKIAFLSLATILLFNFSATTALAAKVTVRPFLIDEVLEQRETLSRDITVKNEADSRLNVYATVNEITVDTEGQIKDFVSPMSSDRTNTVTSWVEITRARIQIDPGETATVPLTLRIHPQAEVGEYHFFIGMVPAPNQPEADSIALRGDADGVIVKIVIDDKTAASLNIINFDIKRFIYTTKPEEIQIEIENSGDAPSIPRGEIIFYDFRGEEVTSLIVNSQQNTITPNGKLTIVETLPNIDKIGRFKAALTIQYNDDYKAVVFDTVQFYIIPYHLIAFLVICILLLSAFLTFVIRYFMTDDVYEETEDGRAVPLYVKTGRDYKEMDHDIKLKKD
jgi:hypothetical protein